MSLQKGPGADGPATCDGDGGGAVRLQGPPDDAP